MPHSTLDMDRITTSTPESEAGVLVVRRYQLLPKSAHRGLMQRFGLTLLACALVIGVTGSASTGDARRNSRSSARR